MKMVNAMSSSYVVDEVPEDSFYENLTLGLGNLLVEIPGVQDVELERRAPCDRMAVTTWEQRHACSLPEDLKNFYLSTDGFRLIWNFLYAGEVLPVGNLRVNTLAELRRLAGNKNCGDSDCPSLLDLETCSTQDSEIKKPSFGVRSKIFELDPCQNIGKICLVYLDIGEKKKDDASVWLLDRSYEWYFLAESFGQYFRMMLVHMGLPQWQFRFTPMGLTPWAEQMMTLLAPHLLSPEPDPDQIDWSLEPVNHIDPAVFKVRTKTSKKGSCTSLQEAPSTSDL